MLLYSPTLAAQEKKTTIEEEKVPFYQGTTIGVDIFGLGSKIFGGDITSTEISVEVNLKNRYVPVAEIGYGTTDTTDDGTNIHYKASAPYFSRSPICLVFCMEAYVTDSPLFHTM